MNATWLFRQLIMDKAPWTTDTLNQLPTREIRMIARILAAPHSLPRQKLVARIIATQRIRTLIAAYTSDQEGIAEMWVSFTGKQMRGMCADVKLWRSGPKRALAAVLLNWRDRARQKGQAAWRIIADELCVGQQTDLPGV